jgi:hypothetical protein
MRIFHGLSVLRVAPKGEINSGARRCGLPGYSTRQVLGSLMAEASVDKADAFPYESRRNGLVGFQNFLGEKDD